MKTPEQMWEEFVAPRADKIGNSPGAKMIFIAGITTATREISEELVKEAGNDDRNATFVGGFLPKMADVLRQCIEIIRPLSRPVDNEKNPS